MSRFMRRALRTVLPRLETPAAGQPSVFAGQPFVRALAHEPLPQARGFELRSDAGELAIEGNVMRGNPSILGTPYSIGYCGEVIFPGAFEGTRERFLAEGFIAQGHEWDELPIAYPTLLEERGRTLYGEAVYHSHQEAQDARAVAQERLAAGKAVGLSIGFFLRSEDYLWFESGAKLLDYAKNNGYDLKQFDRRALKAWDTWLIGVIKIERLVEYSQVTIPANDGAGLIECDSLGAQRDSLTLDDDEPEPPAPDAEAQRQLDASRLRNEQKAARDARYRNLRARQLETLAHSQSKENL